MLKKLVCEREKHFVAVHEEMSERKTAVEDELKGLKASTMDDVSETSWHIDVENFQVLLKGLETCGYVITTAKEVEIVSSQHQPVWIKNKLHSKTSLRATMECVQYFATVVKNRNMRPSEACHVVWLDSSQITAPFSNIVSTHEKLLVYSPGTRAGCVIQVDLKISNLFNLIFFKLFFFY